MIFSRLEAMFRHLTADPVGFFVYIAYFASALVLTLVFHEYAHAYIAYRCGDSTAKMLGRLTLNPLKHLDPMGTAFMVLLGFGWAKPVPINPRNFRNAVKDDFLVSIAGIATNLTLFLLSIVLMIALHKLVWIPEVIEQYGYYDLLKSGSVGYNVIVSGSASFLGKLIQSPFVLQIQRFLMIFAQFNLMVAIFNLLPIPPLDGYHIFNDLIFRGKLGANPRFLQYASLTLMILVFTGVIGNLIVGVGDVIETGVLKTILKLIGV